MEYREFGTFTLLDHMGKGGVGNVYRANDNASGNIVAIKIFEPSEERPPGLVRKLRDREVRMLISVQHPNIVRYYESGDIGDASYYTMEFVENSLLKRMRIGDELELVDKVNILRQTCNALQAIHHQGIVHRDVKPGNILLDETPNGAVHVKVTDLGIAKDVSETDVVRADSLRRVPGTPKYLSPEQIRADPVDGRADIFSLGVVAYELLSGEAPFKADTGEEFLKANLYQHPRPIHHVNPDVPAFLAPLLDKMLAKDREERYDTDTLARDLDLTYQHLVSGAPLVEENNPDSVYYVPPAPELEPPPAPRPAALRWRWPLAATMVALALAVGYVLRPRLPESPPRDRPADLASVPVPSGAAALGEARRLYEAGQRWRALALLRAVDPAQLDQAQLAAYGELQRTVQDGLAAPSYRDGADHLGQDRLTEAEIVLQRMRAFFPHSRFTERLAGEIQERRRLIEEQREWDRKMAELEGLLEREEFREGLARAAAALEQTASEARRAELRQIIARSLNGWQANLLGPQTDPGQIKECLDEIGRYLQQTWARGQVVDRRPELHLRLSRYYRDLGAVEQELEALTRIIEQYPGTPMAKQAAEAAHGIVEDMRLEPLELELLSRHLETNGFKGSMWFSEPAAGAEVRFDGETLVLVQQGAGGERVSSRQTVRPLRTNLGFQLSVKFRMSIADGDGTESCAAGLRVQDRRGNATAIDFNGSRYSMARTYVRHGRPLTGSSSVREAFGDEAEVWHEMAMRYRFDLGRLEILLDGEPVGEHRLELGLCRIGVFVRVTGEGTCRAEFKDVVLSAP